MDKPAIEQFQEMHDAIMDLWDEIAKAMKETAEKIKEAMKGFNAST